MVKKMFYKIKINEEITSNKDFNYVQNLKSFKNGKLKEVTFKPGLNIIFSENGSGKSTILNLLAESMAAKQGGYSCVTEVWHYEVNEKMKGVEILHDGQPVVYFNPRDTIGLILGAFDDDFMVEGVKILHLKESTGFTTMNKMMKILNMFNDKEDMLKSIKYKMSEKYVSQNVKDILKGSQEKQQLTFLMDEPESGLAIHVQNNLFRMIDKAAKEKNIQIIMATHSLFALSCKEANFIELNEGYINIVKNEIVKLAAFAL